MDAQASFEEGSYMATLADLLTRASRPPGHPFFRDAHGLVPTSHLMDWQNRVLLFHRIVAEGKENGGQTHKLPGVTDESAPRT